MPSNRRNIRKRQFDAGKSLKLYRDYEGLYQYLHGDNGSANELKTFEQFEKIENLDKIASMFLKRKNNVPIPDITPGMKENSSNKSEESSKTNFTKVEDKPPVDFYFKPLGPVGQNYIKYTPKVTPLIGEQNYEKVDFMLLKSQWEEFTANVKTLNESHKDIVEEIIDKFEKYTAKDDVHSFEKYKEFIKKVRMISKQKLPSDAQLKGIYNVWVSLRKKIENALLRPFWKKPDINDNSPIASFRSRVPEKMQTRRKNKNDQSNYLKLRMLRKEIF